MKTKKLLAAALAVMMLAGSLAGCKDNQSQQASNTPKGTEPDLAYKVSDKPLELTFFYAGLNGSSPFDDNFPVFVEAARLTNIKLKGTVPKTNSDPIQAFNTYMASGKLDDIVTANKDDFDKYASMGAFVPLDDLIEQYGPNIKKFLNDHNDVKKGITSNDGHIYFLPRIEEGTTAKGWYLRKDWLDKLGLQVPTTVDEFYQVLKAFKTQDPNGNGKQDEVPYFDREKSMAGIYNLFGIRKDFYIDETTNTIKHGKYIPEYQTAVKNAAKWYAEGLIDQEIFTRGSNSREQLLGDNVGGSTHDWFTSTSSYNEKLKDKVPGINLSAIAPPADINGKVFEDSFRGGTYTGWAISTANKHPEETIKYFDFWFSESGRRLFNYGIEGTHYTMVDGQPKYLDSFLDTTKSMTTLWWENGMNIYIGGWQDFNAERQFMSDAALEGMDLYINNNYIAKSLPQLPFTQEERSIISDKMSAVQSLIDEQEQKWVLGTDDVNATFNTYMENCSALGMDDIIKVYNDAYQRYLNS